MSTPTSAPYDVNFYFPVCELENDRVKLTPFILSRQIFERSPISSIRPDQHADLFFQGSSSHPELYQHIPFGPFASAAAFTERLINGRIQPSSDIVLYAILDKTKITDSIRPPTSTDFAGTIGYLNGSPTRLSVEISFIIVLPPFQRTHVSTNAVGLLLRYALELPTASPPGLGLRRMQWQTNEPNQASIRVAERMGMKREARLRWDRIFEDGQGKAGNGEDIRDGDPRPGTLGRHTVMLAICWDDWENGWRGQVARLMDR